MRLLLCLSLFLACAMTLSADTFVYVSMAPEQKIQIYRLGLDDGKLTPVDQVSVDGAPGAIGISPSKKHLYASLRSNFKVQGFRIDPATGKLTELNAATLPKGKNAAFIKVDPTGKWLLTASYLGAEAVVHGLAEDGKIVTPAAQTMPAENTAHNVAFDAKGTWAFVPHVAPNAIFQYRFDPAKGQLTEAGRAPGGAPKAGPRHLAFHPTLPMAFSSDETGSSITAYKFDAVKGLTPVQTLSTLPSSYTGRNTTAEVKVHPNGKFVWVTNRGHDSLAGFRIDEKGGLTEIGQTPTEKTPRSFEIDPSGRFLFGAGEGSGKLAVYRVNVMTGALERINTLDVGKSLTWVTAVSQ